MAKTDIKRLVVTGLNGLRLDWLLMAFRRAKVAYFRAQPSARIFSTIYREHGWGGVESASGTGSDLRETEVVRLELPRLIANLKVRSLLDAPCGDFHWMKETALNGVDYIGGDIVSEIVSRNARLYGGSTRAFRMLDIIQEELPRVDMILCRDALVHFPYREIFLTLENFKRSRAIYLLTTTFPEHANRDVDYMSLWRPLNLQAPPFNLPDPMALINERCPESGAADKSLALWRISDLPSFKSAWQSFA